MVNEELKSFLDGKVNDCKIKIKKMKAKRKIIKIIYNTTIVVSISASTITASVASAFALPLLPHIIIITLSGVSAVAVGISTKFNLKGRKQELNKMITQLEILKQQIAYVIACNGDLTEQESKEIIKKFV